MDAKQVLMVKAHLIENDTAELLEIWNTNDRKSYTDEAFEAIRLILTERGVAAPEQSVYAPIEENTNPESKESRRVDAASETKRKPQTEAGQHISKAYNYNERNNFEDTLREADAAIKLDPALAEAHNLRGMALEELGREADAAIKLDPALAEAHNLRGMALEELGREAEAIEAYRQAIVLNPDFCEAKNNLSLLEQELAEKYQPVTITAYDHPVEANIAKDILESEGIYSVIIETRRGGAFVPQTWGFGRACLQVRKPDVERACELLDIKPVVSEELDKETDENQEPQAPAARRSPFTRHEKRKRTPPSKKRR